MPKQGGDFEHIRSGTNSQGNHWCVRDYDDEGTRIHYSNKDGSFYYENPDGSKYFNNGNGYSEFTPPGGETRISDK